MFRKVQKAADYIRSKAPLTPELAIVLGSGLGALAESMKERSVIPYADIPGFPRSSVEGHAAKLVIGRLGKKTVAMMQGRFHYYEGFTMRELAFPIYVLRALGISDLIVTNACGGINETFHPGDLMLIEDHINLSGQNPLIGDNDERFGPRFPDMTEVYDKALTDTAEKIARQLSVPIKRGVYAFFTGPCYETAAEIRAYKVLGADAIGMSTVPEATVAHYLGMRVLGIACITNMATGIAKTKHSHKEVLSVAKSGSENFINLIYEIVQD